MKRALRIANPRSAPFQGNARGGQVEHSDSDRNIDSNNRTEKIEFHKSNLMKRRYIEKRALRVRRDRAR
ncbi:hypothetical protein J6590_071985 [Homalodisca vitripennis]|nr:hypothetical protein J6590_091380 [Homalodisca vitripennis]KAG8310013.1 hypothetical protein J6590_071985 [Homalodisca vitripennis]